MLDNPFTPEKVQSTISLSVYNRPSSMAARRPHTAYTADDLVRKMPGWKPPPTAPAAEGEVAEDPAAVSAREPILPDFNTGKKFEMISRDGTEAYRQQQLMEIHSIRDYLAKPNVRGEKDKANVNIPLMKTFERAIMLPPELQTDPLKKYPTYGENLMINPFPKKKKKGKKGKKKRR